MKRFFLATPYFSVVLLTAFALGPRISEAQGGYQNKSIAVCILQISCDPETEYTELPLIEALISSKDILWPAVEEVSGLSLDTPEFNPPNLILEAIGTSRDSTTKIMRLAVHSKDERLSADELMRNLVDRLRHRIEELVKGSRKKRHESLMVLKVQEDKKAREIEQKQRTFSEVASSLGFSGLNHLNKENREALLLKLISQRQEIELKLRSLSGRHSELSKRFSQIAVDAQEQVQDDPVVRELTEVVEARERELELLGEVLKEQPRELEQRAAEHRLELLRFRVELEKAREQALQRKGGDMVRELKDQIVTTVIEEAEATQSAKFLDERIQDVSNSGSAELDAMRRNLEVEGMVHVDLLKQLEETELALQLSIGPTVTILAGGSSTPAAEQIVPEEESSEETPKTQE